MMKKYLEDLERFVGFIRLSAHQLVSAKPTEGVSCGQKSYKSEQIEQISIDEKNDLEDLERFGRFLGEADWKRVCLAAQTC